MDLTYLRLRHRVQVWISRDLSHISHMFPILAPLRKSKNGFPNVYRHWANYPTLGVLNSLAYNRWSCVVLQLIWSCATK